MMPMKRMAMAAVLSLVAGSAFGQGLEMQVEEPSSLTPPPIDPDRDAGAWHQKTGTGEAGLNKAEQAAWKERRKQVEEMASEVRAKREALLSSGQEERAARIKELEQLILDAGQGGAGLQGASSEKIQERLDKRLEKQVKVQEKQLEKLEKKLEKSLDEKLEKLDKDVSGTTGKSKKGKSGK